MKHIRLIALSAIFLGITSCNSGTSLEKYFVTKTEEPGFTAIDLAPSLIQHDPAKITAEQSQALEKIDKMNILVYQSKEGSNEAYKAERDSVSAILKKGTYEELARFGSAKGGASITMKGKGDKADEFVIYAYSEDMGFAVARLLGDEMTVNDIMSVMSLMKDSNVDLDQLKPLQDILKKQP